MMRIGSKLKGAALAVAFALGLIGAAHSVVITGTESSGENQIIRGGYFRMSVTDSITALSGGAQAGTPLVSAYNRVTTVAAANDSVQLPICLTGTAGNTAGLGNTAGMMVVVTNAAASNSMNVFPQTGQSINALSANAAYAMAANKTSVFICSPGGTIWYSVLGG